MKPSDVDLVVRCNGCKKGSQARLSEGDAWATAGGGPSVSGLADGVCALGGRFSRMVSHLWAGAGVHGGHPARRCPAARTAWSAGRMRATPPGTPCQGRGVPGASSVASRGRRQGCRGGSPGVGDTPSLLAHHARRGGNRLDAVGGRWHTLHSVRLGSPGQAASVRGLSNEALELHLGAAWGAWCCPSARRTSTLMR